MTAINNENLAELWQQAGLTAAKIAASSEPWYKNARQDIAHAANCLTVAARLREEVYRLEYVAAQEALTTFGKSVPEQLQESIEAIRSATDHAFPVHGMEDQAPTDEKGSSIRIAPSDPLYGVHMSHCFDGENEGCKYGQDEICPARLSPPSGSRAPAPARLRDELERIVMQQLVTTKAGARVTADRILNALILKAQSVDWLISAQEFLRDVKAGTR